AQDKWVDDEYITFEPKIEGKFKWTSGNTLIFSPDVPLQPIQSYKAEITDKVLFGRDVSLKSYTYEFRTQDFDVTKVDFFWAHIPNEQYQIGIKANLYFNYPVNPGMLKDYLSFKKDGQAINNFNIMSDKASDVIAVDLGNVQQTDKEQELSVAVKEGLMSVIGKKGLEDNREFKYKLPPLTRLAITGVTSGLSDNKKWIEVSTTQRVDDKKLKDYVKLNPQTNVTFYINENSFRIEGSFDNMQSIDLIINKGLPGLYGGELAYEFEQQITFANLDPSLSFTDQKGKYLMLSGQKNLELSAVNIPGVDIEVSQVYKNNVLFFLRQYNRYNYYNDYYSNYSPYYNIEAYGHQLFKEKRKLKDNPNSLEKFSVNLDAIRDKKLKGIFVVNVTSTEDRWRRASKMLALSDLGIISKKSSDQLLVFVNSIATTEPVSNVDITLISSNNQTVLTGKTNSEGVASFKNLKQSLQDFTPRVITAEKGDDFNFIDLNESGVETSRFDVGGQTEYTSGYKTFLYGDRQLYRTGEQVHLSGIVRDDFTNVIKNVPISVKIISPTGKVYDDFKLNLNDQGSFDISFKMETYAQTGQYRAEVYTGSDNLIGAYNFNVEDFVPDKIRVILKTDKKEIKPGGNNNIKINAEYLFGAKASGLQYETDFQLRHKTFVSKKYPAYNFGNSSFQNPNIPNSFVKGNLDNEGNANVKYIDPADLKSSGIVSCYAFVSVFGLSGRTVNRMASFDIYPDTNFIGIKTPGYYFGTNETINFKTIAVDKNDNTVNDFKVDVKLVKLEWHTVLKKNNSGRYIYASEKQDVVQWEKEMDLSGGEKNIPVVVSRNGEYELRISRKQNDYYQYASFYAYGWYSTTASSFQVDKEGRVDIVFDKQSYEPGEKAKILFTTPFAGKMLVTLERNGVYFYKFIEVTSRSTELEVKIDENYIPNVYVTATLFKKHTADQSIPFLVAHGFASVKVERKSRHLPVSIISQDKIKPGVTTQVKVRTSDQKNIFVTLAAVDEGILQIKNYQTPDPYAFMYAKRALDVSSYDLYKLLLPEIITLKSPGGDEVAKQLQKRTNPITTKRFNLLAVWSGILKTDGEGEVKIPIKIPEDFNGEVRLMTIAYDGNRFGSAEKRMKVSDDLIIEPQIPRFLAPNDSLVMPVSIINTSNSTANTTVGLNVEGSLKISSSKSLSVRVEANSTAAVQFVITTGNQIGTGKILLKTSGFANAKNETNIAVRPASPYYTENFSGQIRNNDKINLPPASDYVSGTVDCQLTISKFPAIKFAKFLKYLVGYPYGCVEQTTSKLFPQLYFEDLAKLVAPQYYKTTTPVYFVQEGIRKLESMQLSDGSLSYWQGGTYSNWWGTVYAAHFLVEAKKAGFNVSDNVLSRLLDYIGKKARQRGTYEYVWYNNNNSRTYIKIADKEILYSLYVLADAGRGDLSTMNYYKSKPGLVSNDCKYLLAGAYALMDNWPAYYEIVPDKFIPEKTDRLTGGSFDSEARANAIMLNVLLEVDPSNKQIPFIIKYLTGMMGSIYSTQDRSFAFLALGKAAKLGAFYDMNVDVFADVKKVGAYNGKDITLNINPDSKSITLQGSKQGTVYYFYNLHGVKKGNVKQFDSHLKIRRSYYDFRTGDPIINNHFYQGELLVCRIDMTGGEVSADNIVIADLLPSGFEIDNPRLSDTPQLSKKYSSTMNIQYMDIRDDRLILFTGAKRNTKDTFYYLIRVVNKGKFVLPVISAEAMYDGEISSVNDAGIVYVK
ncbi:MAG TPA: MG2 domain-containing protein, partial [Ignavibacteriaceae bacterium]|nr:MG2 domain-containing protein [Ignavibacteriaceae bacterium]